MILDGSSAHRNGILNIPKNVTLHFLPPYSPMLNPIEQLWLFIKKKYLSFKLYKIADEIIQAGQEAWNKITPEIVKSISNSKNIKINILDMEKNIATAFDLVRTAANSGSKLVILPEMFTYMGEESFRKKTKDNLKSGLFLKLSNLARELKITLIAGSHSESVPNNENKVYNTCVTFDSCGEMISVYRKLHLFNLKDTQGNPIYCESDSFEVGEPPVPYVIQDKETNETWNALNIICYDIRFPEVIRHNKKPTDIIFVPAAFTWQTGKDHWEILLRARAIENQCFVLACNQTGFHTDGKKRNYGHSMVIDPWGNVIAKLGEECGILSCILDKNLIIQSRTRLSALGDRKL